MCEVCDQRMFGRRDVLGLAGMGLAAAATGLFSQEAMASGNTTTLTADQALEKLKAGNARYVANPQLCVADLTNNRSTVAKGQAPWASFVSCADSRVPPELLFGGVGLGELFVSRNAGNMVDTATMGTLEYGAEHLGVPLIVVLGHEACGAVAAAFQRRLVRTPSLAQLVGQLRMELVDLGADDDLELACRRHTLNSAHNLVDSSVLLTDRLRQGTLKVEAAYYNLHTTSIDWMGSVTAQPIQGNPIRSPMPVMQYPAST